MKAMMIAILFAQLALPTLGNEAVLPQTTCPVMVGNPIDPSLHVDYEGQRVYFCCKNCVRMFSENPTAYLQNLPLFAAEDAHGHDGGSEIHNSAGREEEAHNHETDHEEMTEARHLVAFLGKFHPVAVHLPIALVLGAALAELLYMLTWNILFRNAAVFNLLLAVLGAAAAVPLGLAAASGTRYPAEYAQTLSFHKWLGISTLFLAAATAALALWASRKAAGKRDQRPYRIVLIICVGLVGATGHLGGLLVFGLGYFSW